MLLFERIVLILKIRGKDVPHAQAISARLVHIGGADALERGTDLGLSLGGLTGGVQHPVRGKDQMGAFGNLQFIADGAHPLLDGVDFLQQDYGVDDHAVANHIHRSFAENAGRNRMEDEAVSVKDQRMAGVGATLETGHHFVGRC